MDAALGGHLEPVGFAATIHAMGAWRGIAIVACGAMAAEQLAFLQAVEKRRVLFVAVDVIHLEMRADGERINRKHLGAAFDFRQFGLGRHRGSSWLINRANSKAFPKSKPSHTCPFLRANESA